MKRNKRTFSFDVLLLWLSIITIVTLRTVAISRHLDFEFGYYTGETLITVSGWLTFAVCTLFFIGALSARKNEPFIPVYNTPATYIPSALVAVSLLFLGKNLFGQFSEMLGKTVNSVGVGLAFVCAVCAICGAVGFFFYVMQEDTKSPLRSYFTMLLASLFILYAIYLYFDTTLPINAPNKITDQVAYIAVAIFFLFEARISMGQFSKKGYSAIGYSTALITAYSSIPSICTFFISGKIISNSIYETVLTFALFLFVSARLILISEYESDSESEIVRSIRKASNEKITAEEETSSAEEDVTEPENTADEPENISEKDTEE